MIFFLLKKKLIFTFSLFFILGCRSQQTPVNSLKNELSPYLVENSKSPVDWHPWNKKTIQRAQRENKLIYLSIGFLSCYSCQKMDLEIHSSPRVAEKLKKSYIAIKVDREERPDIDSYFLNMQAAIMKFGGWPIQLILTPQLKPLFSLTFMQENPFLGIVENIERAWRENPEKLIQESSAFLEKIKPTNEAPENFNKDHQFIHQFYSHYTHSFDPLWGGKKISPNFTPKFAINEDLRLLLRYYLQTQEKQALQMVKKTLSSVIRSATLDPLEGGFHRYSLTREWTIPQFEKTLVDQASYLSSLIELYQVDPQDSYKNVIEKTMSFILTRFQRPTGGFYNSIRSESNLVEGSYYTWQKSEIQNHLSPQDWMEFQKNYGLSSPISHYGNRSVLYKSRTEPSQETKVDQKLIKLRETRNKIQPDRQVTTSSNAYLLSSLAKIARLWPSKELNQIIEKNFGYIIRQHFNPQDQLYRLSRDGRVRSLAVLDDYAFLIDALIEYYQTSFEKKYLLLADQLQTTQDLIFFDPVSKLYRFNQAEEDFLKDQFLFKDQSQPSGQSLSHFNLLRLGLFGFDSSLRRLRAKQILNAYPDLVKSDPMSYATLLLSLDFDISQPKRITIYAEPDDCQKRMLEISKNFFPYKVVLCQSKEKSWSDLFFKNKAKEESFQVCDSESCQEKTSDFTKALTELYRQ